MMFSGACVGDPPFPCVAHVIQEKVTSHSSPSITQQNPTPMSKGLVQEKAYDGNRPNENGTFKYFMGQRKNLNEN